MKDNHNTTSKNYPQMPPPEKKFPPSSSSAALLLCLLFSFSLLALTTFFHRPTSPSPTRWFSLIHPSSSPGPFSLYCQAQDDLNSSTSSPTHLSHIVFALGGSAKTWDHRQQYSNLWWDPNSTRGFIWLDERPQPNYTWPINSPPYKVSSPVGPTMRSSDRMARILKETFQLGLPRVRWFVMGDDDTVFFTDNLVTVLSKYDHRQMYYVGGSSESVEQDVMHGYDTAFGGGGFAVSYPLACHLVRILDGCINRYINYYGSDEKVAACVAEIGVPLTREPGFHQLDIRDDPYGLLAAHPMAPLVSLHHLDYVKPLFPGQTQVDSLRRLMHAYHVDPGHIIQQNFCYDHRRQWSVSISWGYTVQLYPSLVPSRVLSTPLHTFRTWRSWSDGPFVFNTRPLASDPCEKPIIYYLDQVKEIGEGRTITTYKRIADAETGKKCNKASYKYAMSVEKITVSASKTSPDKWMQAAHRDCCEITDSWTVKTNMRVNIRSCKVGETITMVFDMSPIRVRREKEPHCLNVPFGMYSDVITNLNILDDILL